ncbi:MAG: hypothetical protein RLZZ238_844 [Planctomycetota bacterium]
MKCMSVMSCLLVTVASAHADLVGSYTIGSGTSTSFVQFEFTNANTYLYEVRYDGAMSGSDLLAVIAAAQPDYFSYEVQSFSFGDVLFGVSIGADADAGFGTPPDYLDYWHYWTKEPGDAAWTESWIGFGDRVVLDGSWDGWVFNSANAPSTVPGPGAVCVLALARLLRRRGR